MAVTRSKANRKIAQPLKSFIGDYKPSSIMSDFEISNDFEIARKLQLEEDMATINQQNNTRSNIQRKFTDDVICFADFEEPKAYRMTKKQKLGKSTPALVTTNTKDEEEEDCNENITISRKVLDDLRKEKAALQEKIYSMKIQRLVSQRRQDKLMKEDFTYKSTAKAY
ncbi:rpoB [Acrasis kona]|uniref:RpoB n=1 Tax=Acrasis kona TaxID=1008807 RepID=A0AAW2Z736_9EUKA